MQGNPQDYYFIDDKGNLVPPPGPDQPRGNVYPPDATEPDRRPEPGGQANSGQAAPAASDDFLERATGGMAPPRRNPPPSTARGIQAQQP